MEITAAVLEQIRQITPGAYSVYEVDGGRLLQLLRSEAVLPHSAYSAEEYEKIVKEDAGNIVFQSDRSYVAAALADLLRTKSELDITYRVRHKTRQFVWIHAFGRLIGTRDGKPVIMAAFSSTSGESDKHAHLLENTATAVYVVGLHRHEILYINSSARKLWNLNGYAERPCYQGIFGRDSVCPWCMIEKMENGIFIQKDYYVPGLDKWLNVRCLEMDWYGHPAVGIYAYDVTDEVRLRRKLELRKKDMEFVVDNIPVGVGVCTLLAGRIEPIAINYKMTELLGTTAELFMKSDRDMFEHVHAEDRESVMRTMAGCAVPGSEMRTDYRYRISPEHSWRWYRLIVRSIAYGAGSMAFVCLLDVTAEKNAAMEAMRSRSMYQTASSASGYFDCILMDIRMPVLNGYEATEKIRSLVRPDAKTVPILAMTADAFDDDVQKCLKAGMNGHIAKPIDPAKLCRSVLRTVRGPGDPEKE